MCTGIEVLAAAAVTSAVASTTLGVLSYEAGQDAAAAQKSLADQQAAQLKSEQDAASALAKAQETTGSSFGFGDQQPKSLETGFGFGTAPQSSPNSGRSQITGMG